MKITYLHQYFNTPSMSGGTRSYEMAKRLVAMGHEVTMITSWREPTEEVEWFETCESGIKVCWLPIEYSNHMSYRERIKAFFRFATLAARKASSMSADIVFATSTPLTIAFPGIIAAKRLRVPMVFEVRDLWPELPIAIGAIKNPLLKYAASLLEKIAYRNAARVVALSPGMKAGVIRAGFPEHRVEVIPNSADLELFDPANTTAGTFLTDKPELIGRKIVMYAGTLGVINGVGYLVRTAKEALEAGSDIRFVIVGAGAELDKIVRDAQESDVLGRNLHIYPPVPKENMPSVLASADIAVSLFVDLEPMWANSANKFFDALAAAKPIAINYGGWQADIIEEAGAGFRLPADDPKLAFSLISEFIHDEKALQAAAGASRGVATAMFDREHLAQQLERVFLDVRDEYSI